MREINFDEALDIALTQRQIDRAQGAKRKRPSRAEVEQGFLEAFELVGGITRLAIWANKESNYGEFLKLYSKLVPKEVSEEAGQVFIYESAVPASGLNKPAAITHVDVEDLKETNNGSAP
jgi:hypothetical protein